MDTYYDSTRKGDTVVEEVPAPYDIPAFAPTINGTINIVLLLTAILPYGSLKDRCDSSSHKRGDAGTALGNSNGLPNQWRSISRPGGRNRNIDKAEAKVYTIEKVYISIAKLSYKYGLHVLRATQSKRGSQLGCGQDVVWHSSTPVVADFPFWPSVG